MAASSVRVQFVVDTKVLERRMREAGREFEPRVLLKAIGEKQVAWIMQNFNSEGGLVGGWEPLSPNTIANRERGGSSPLHGDTGMLRASLNHYEIIGDEAVVVGSNMPYASFHNEGAEGPWTITPRTPGGVLHFKMARSIERVQRPGREVGVGGRVGTRLKIESDDVFVRSVEHPGIPQRRFLPTEEEAEGMAVKLIDAKIEQLERIARGAR